MNAVNLDADLTILETAIDGACEEIARLRKQKAELLAALKAIVEHEQIDGTGIRYTFDWNSPLGRQARAAIKNAEGK